ncbi:probable cytochrome P450 28a5 [Chironomus tepperi]|uniref:probable cytochrome P450 28a5 n=1 Tax=Chironomus tepperi TaxID=113505 RepID=UPI00391F5FFA
MWKSISTSTQLPSSPITRDVNQYFIRIANHAVERRRYSNEKRNDLLNYIISLKDKRNFSEIETAAHAMTFWLDGFETSSLALCYVLYELSKNIKVQDKLRIEINENIDNNQTIPIETLLNLTYLDQVFYEAIRLHPPLYYTTRQCNESIELISDEQKILIPSGTTIWIPIYSIHRDPDIYENPHEFMPERFDDENGGVKAFRDKCALIPFGESARICLGMKLGTLQIKAAVVELLRNFELICDESVTDKDLEIRPQQFSNIPMGDIKVQFRKLSEA